MAVRYIRRERYDRKYAAIAGASAAIRLEGMDTDRSSHELLGHFGRPQSVICPDFDWDETDCGASEFDPEVVDVGVTGSSPGARSPRQPRPQPPDGAIGVWRVLQWAAAVAVLGLAAGTLVEFAQGIAAERALRIAARAAATEATLPKATYESVTAAVGRRLAAYPELKERVQLTLLKNGVPVGERLLASGGDRISVTISAPARVSGWILGFSLHRDAPPMIVQAEGHVMGRTLRSGRM
jgi:hypothetical protein